MNEKQLIKLIEVETDAYLSYPFNKPGVNSTIKWSVLKHQKNDKILAMVYVKDEELLMNVKLLPEHSESLRMLKGVEPGYHMNKKYWSTIAINNTELTLTELKNIIKESYELTR
ncbi:MmcQ/YjbR family DNA-binding protein [Weissella coleopterorum]|uniref:MmcQ/YjbR family DNA-binding protein n=1 Tax=Weissella coleopterorum TaxID=2714949 RepID=A0A6G8AYX0_9LACO|nr:MmcQ/YjbR family DNA-binding protein [Weissella coleopterorum]QIL50152.1 MmcQ/YjbR family DNA-binding protein [Weissella coleopterorum]